MSDIKVFFATNRDTLSEADAAANPADPGKLSFGSVEVERVGFPLKTEADRHLAASPQVSGLADGGKAVLDAWLTTAEEQGATALLFIHGFSNTFGAAIRRAAQIAEFYRNEGVGPGVNLVPLAFSWPSDGAVFLPNAGFNLAQGAIDQYKADQTDAARAAPALARLIMAISEAKARRASSPRCVVLAHSMGNWALANGLRALDDGRLTKSLNNLFDHAVLVASDIASDALNVDQPLRNIALLAERTTVAINHDPVLSEISKIANGNERLGFCGCTSLAGLPETVEVVDVFPGLSFDTRDRVLATGGTEYDLIGHQWYRNDTNARRFLGGRIAGLADSPAPMRLEPREQTQAGRTRHAFLPQPATS